MPFEIINDETGAIFAFPSKAAWEKALDWYNRTSKQDIIQYCKDHGLDLTEPTDDPAFPEGVKLVADWDDRARELWVRKELAARWFAFRAWNSQEIYGYGTPDEADRYTDHLNAGREINLYAAEPVSDEDAEELELEDNTEAFDLADALRELEY